MTETFGVSSHAENKWFLLEMLLQCSWLGLGCTAGAVHHQYALWLPADGFPCWLLQDLPFLIEGLLL